MTVPGQWHAVSAGHSNIKMEVRQYSVRVSGRGAAFGTHLHLSSVGSIALVTPLRTHSLPLTSLIASSSPLFTTTLSIYSTSQLPTSFHTQLPYIINMSDNDNTPAATGSAPQFTERELQLLGWAMQSLKSGPPEVGFASP
jgi:hypothetical protein